MGKVPKGERKKRDATFDGLLGFKVTKACFDEFLPMLYELARRKTDGMDFAQARAFADDSIVPIWEAHEMDTPDKHPDIYPPNTTALDARKKFRHQVRNMTSGDRPWMRVYIPPVSTAPVNGGVQSTTPAPDDGGPTAPDVHGRSLSAREIYAERIRDELNAAVEAELVGLDAATQSAERLRIRTEQLSERWSAAPQQVRAECEGQARESAAAQTSRVLNDVMKRMKPLVAKATKTGTSFAICHIVRLDQDTNQLRWNTLQSQGGRFATWSTSAQQQTHLSTLLSWCEETLPTVHAGGVAKLQTAVNSTGGSAKRPGEAGLTDGATPPGEAQEDEATGNASDTAREGETPPRPESPPPQDDDRNRTPPASPAMSQLTQLSDAELVDDQPEAESTTIPKKAPRKKAVAAGAKTAPTKTAPTKKAPTKKDAATKDAAKKTVVKKAVAKKLAAKGAEGGGAAVPSASVRSARGTARVDYSKM